MWIFCSNFSSTGILSPSTVQYICVKVQHEMSSITNVYIMPNVKYTTYIQSKLTPETKFAFQYRFHYQCYMRVTSTLNFWNLQDDWQKMVGKSVNQRSFNNQIKMICSTQYLLMSSKVIISERLCYRQDWGWKARLSYYSIRSHEFNLI